MDNAPSAHMCPGCGIVQPGLNCRRLPGLTAVPGYNITCMLCRLRLSTAQPFLHLPMHLQSQQQLPDAPQQTAQHLPLGRQHQPLRTSVQDAPKSHEAKEHDGEENGRVTEKEGETGKGGVKEQSPETVKGSEAKDGDEMEYEMEKKDGGGEEDDELKGEPVRHAPSA